ncbi:MAG: hypothetical protein Q8P41_14555 [Pseudomonadota bacterium]|nr:hypothetical protein [Pseudomonadota bacterium]
MVPAVLGVREPVARRTYLAAGLALGGVKYLVDAAVIYAATGHWVSPLLYLLPVAQLRFGGPSPSEGVLLGLLLWTLPFAWIGGTMSVRRARDAGLPAPVGLLFYVPLVNYVAIAALALAPTRRAPSTALVPLQGVDRATWAALIGVGAGVTAGLAMTGLSVYVLGAYGAGLFVGAPVLMGGVASWLFNLRRPQGVLATLGVTSLTVGITGGLLLLFALEGILCITMAAPIALVLAGVGGLLGAALARVESRLAMSSFALVPAFAAVEPMAPPVRAVITTVDVAAPPEVVWELVTAFPEIPAPTPSLGTGSWWLDRGVAYPVRARIEGTGVGAVRYCEFSTGPFVEPITTWDPPSATRPDGRLAFDVTGQPPVMTEWNPWHAVDAPHLQETLRSRRGEFLLTALPDGGTRLQGTTWYTIDMAPQLYWTAWSDALIHDIHLRVLNHIAREAERR